MGEERPRGSPQGAGERGTARGRPSRAVGGRGDVPGAAGGAGRDRSGLVPGMGHRVAALLPARPEPHPGRRHTPGRSGRRRRPEREVLAGRLKPSRRAPWSRL
ncbi:hypothetical protein OHV04_37420 [Streptomyces sp. NBC_00046]